MYIMYIIAMYIIYGYVYACIYMCVEVHNQNMDIYSY